MKSLYFAAILPPKGIEEKINSVKKEFSNVYKSFEALKSPAYLTLKEPFMLGPKDETLLLRKLDGLSFVHQPFQQELKDFDHFQKYSIYIKTNKCVEITSLKKNMKRVFKEYFLDIQQDQMPFNPHYGIAYKDIPEKNFALAWENYQQKTFEADFKCTQFSLLKHAGGKWVNMQDFKLRGLPQQTLFDDLDALSPEEKSKVLVLK